MFRYIIRRLLHLIPTVLGVIVITFILFNLVGGSPGRMALGQKASPEQVDAFLSQEVEPIRQRYPQLLGQKRDVHV